jgi:hypothetical protein
VIVDEYPKGIPRLSAFVSSDDDFAMVRGFSRWRHRLILHLQVEMTELEKALDELDKRDAADPAMMYRRVSTQQRQNGNTEQVELMSKLKAKTKEYGKHPASCLVHAHD